MLQSSFTEIYHSGNDARIVLEQNEFSKKVTPYMDWALDSRTVVLNCVYSLMPSHLS